MKVERTIHDNGQTPIMTYQDWLATCDTDEPCLIDQVLPEDAGEYMLVSGKTGIGKSVLTMHLAFSLATGQPFMGMETQEVVVGMLAMEGGRDNIRDRFVKIAGQYPDTNNFKFELAPPMDLEKHYKDLKVKLEGCRVVILDNLRQVTTGKYLDMNYAARWLKAYQQLLAEIGAVGVLTHHIKKPNEATLIEPGDVYNLKGATEYVDASTTVLLLERKRQGHSEGGGFARVDKNHLMLHFAKQRIATRDLQPIELYRNYDKCSFDVIVEGEIAVIAGGK